MCSSEKTIFIVFQQSTAVAIKNCMLRKSKNIWKTVGVFEHGKMVFFGLFFEVVMVLWFVFWCVWYSRKSVKHACFFPSFWGFCVVVYSCLFGFGRFRCFVVFVYVFFVQVLFLFVLALVLFCCWIVVGVILVFLVFVCLFLF